jgi:hypothetical protein
MMNNSGILIPSKIQMQPTAHLRIVREKLEDGRYNMVFQQLHVGPQQDGDEKGSYGRSIGEWKLIPIIDVDPSTRDFSCKDNPEEGEDNEDTSEETQTSNT